MFEDVLTENVLVTGIGFGATMAMGYGVSGVYGFFAHLPCIPGW